MLAAILLLSPYLWWVQLHWRAAALAQSWDIQEVKRATLLETSNPDHHHLLGRFYLFAMQDPASAVQEFKTTAKLDPWNSQNWLDLATAERMNGNIDGQRAAVEKALEVDPRTPEVAWDAANFNLSEGKIDRALTLFRTVTENDPENMTAALESSLRATQDPDRVAEIVLPPRQDAYLAYLAILMRYQQTSAAMKVWEKLLHLEPRLESIQAVPFLQYLQDHHALPELESAWQGLAEIYPGLRQGGTDSADLIVDGGFEEEILNGGLSWRVDVQPNVDLQIDNTASHNGNRSMRMEFNGQAVIWTGLHQFVAVQPNTNYDLSFYVHSNELETANGPRMLVQDGYTHNILAQGEEWRGTRPWHEEHVSFTTGPETGLVVILIGRTEGDRKLIKGTAWLDDVRLKAR